MFSYDRRRIDATYARYDNGQNALRQYTLHHVHHMLFNLHCYYRGRLKRATLQITEDDIKNNSGLPTTNNILH